MDQEKTGKFIARMRREKEMTQAQLGERLGVTNKTVSRWETGKYMPDISTLSDLSRELGITVNELLSGELLTDKEFRKAADANLLLSMAEGRKLRVQKHVAEILTGGGIGILFGNLNAPESPERATMIMIVFAALVLGQLLRGRYEETLLGWFEGKRRR